MKASRFFTTAIVICILLVGFLYSKTKPDFINYVNPLIGTSTAQTKNVQGEGSEIYVHCIPAVTLPFAMTQWTLETRSNEQKCVAPFYYEDAKVQGIRGTHWMNGSCTQDYGSFTIMPVSGKLNPLPDARSSIYDKKHLQLSPAHMQVLLTDDSISVRISPTLRSTVFDIEYSQNENYLIINTNSNEAEGVITLHPDEQKITGYNPAHRIYQGWGEPAGFAGHVVIQLDCGFSEYGVFKGDSILYDQTEISGDHTTGVFVKIDQKQCTLKAGTSFTGMKGAEKNLKHELKDRNLQQIIIKADSTWNGYIPMEDPVKQAFHKNEQVSRTLEYAYDDYCAAVIAKAAGNKEDDQTLMRRSGNYPHVFDQSVLNVRGRHENGDWYHIFEPDKKMNYICEGTPNHYKWYVPHDIPGLIRLFGGENEFLRHLDDFFAKEQYWHGNEPGHQIPYLYAYTRQPEKTRYQVRKILRKEYHSGIGGLSGNEDAGQLSAWLVFSAMGFYPVCPGTDTYAIASPPFQRDHYPNRKQ